VAGSAEHNSELSVYIQSTEFLHQLSDYKLLRQGSAAGMAAVRCMLFAKTSCLFYLSFVFFFSQNVFVTTCMFTTTYMATPQKLIFRMLEVSAGIMTSNINNPYLCLHILHCTFRTILKRRKHYFLTYSINRLVSLVEAHCAP
jgi:hypothetical protein